MRSIAHYVQGAALSVAGARTQPIFNPSLGVPQATLELGDVEVVARAVESARVAQPEWAAVNSQRRARVMFEFKRLLEAHMDELAMMLAQEHGKVLADARGELQRGIDIVEFYCGGPHLLKGEYSDGVGPGIDVYSMRQPLGVVAGITPFNFPAMVPLWMLAPAIVCGNAFVLKPSERDPSVSQRLAELLIEAGLPPGILNIVQGDRVVVDALLDHPDIKAISFVGSTEIARYVYECAAARGKRVQAMGGAKNHGVVMPDADLDQAVADIIGAAFGSAGERCMALPVVMPVGAATAEALRARLTDAIAGLRVGVSTDPQAQFGPVISAPHKARIESYIQLGVDEGAELVVDGRGFSLQGYEAGYFLGPTLFDHVTPTMRSYQEEIFGPVLQMVRAASLDEAIGLVDQHPYGNGVAVFTRSGDTAREFVSRIEVGMVGVNVPIPVPVAYHSFGGWKRSGFGDLNQYGMDGIRFYTRTKTVTQRWPTGAAGAAPSDQSFNFPTMQ